MLRTQNPIRRRDRRKLGKDQYPTQSAVTVIVSSSGTTNMTLTFSRPVVVTGTIGTTVAGLTLVSQTVVSPITVSQVWSGNVATKAWTVPGDSTVVATATGGRLAGASGTFP